MSTAETLTATPVYGAVVAAYRRAGWLGVLPLPPGRKWPPPTGYTGEAGADPSGGDVATWAQHKAHHNVALRMPEGVVGIDVDQYDKPADDGTVVAKRGADELATLEAELGPLPPTWSSSARDWPSGIRLYRVPAGVRLRTDPLPSVEVVQRHHRYVVAPPSTNPEAAGLAYRWRTPEGAYTEQPPRVDELPELPAAWLDRWRVDAERPEVRDPIPPRPAPAGVDRSAAVQRVLDDRRPWTAGSRHDEALRLSMALARLEHGGYPGATDALALIGAEFIAVKPEAGVRHGTAPSEWEALLASARTKAATTAATRPDYADAVAEGRARAAAERARGLAGWPGVSTDVDTSPAGELHPAEEDAPTSWEPVDVVAELRSGGPPPPDVLTHARGYRLLYAGRTHAFFGPSESLKSWAAQAATAEVLLEGRPVLFIDYEDDAASVGARLVALGVPEDAIAAHLVYVRPNEALVDRQGRWTPAGLRFLELVDERPWALAVLDGMTEAMSTEGLDLNDNADAASFARRILRPLADTGAAVVGIDHQPKNAGETGRYAIGSQHKLAGLTGAAYRFEPERPLGRPAGTEPVTGLSKVTVSKDRPGYVRGRTQDGAVGLFRVTAWPDGKLDADIIDRADLGDEGADMVIAGRVLTHLATYEGASKNQLEESVVGNRDAIRAVTSWMVGKGWIEVRPVGTAHRHYLTDTGRQEVPA